MMPLVRLSRMRRGACDSRAYMPGSAGALGDDAMPLFAGDSGGLLRRARSGSRRRVLACCLMLLCRAPPGGGTDAAAADEWLYSTVAKSSLRHGMCNSRSSSMFHAML